MYRNIELFRCSNYIALIAIIILALPYITYTQLQFHHQEEILKRQKQNLNFHQDPHHHISHFGFISNLTLTGNETGCKFFTKYEVTSIVNYQMCVGQNTIDLKNGDFNYYQTHFISNLTNLIQSTHFRYVYYQIDSI